MANIELDIAGRKYPVACRDGEEDHLRSVAALVDKRARDAASALGSLGENRLMLFTALMLADDLQEANKGGSRAAAPAVDPQPAADPQIDEALIAAIELLAERVEALAESAERRDFERA